MPRTHDMAIANALQLEAARATPVLFRFNYDAMPSLNCIFVSLFGYLAAFSIAGGSELSDVLNDAKFHTF